jgi:hypothetical protein
MRGSITRRSVLGTALGALALSMAKGARSMGSTGWTLDQLVRLSPPEIEGLYATSGVGQLPSGKAAGRAILFGGSKLAAPASRIGRAFWQGKVFSPEQGRAVNRFFGIRSVPAALGFGPSWRDGNPAIILDYAETSRIYAPYRDEIREVSPGLFLGLMFDRRTSPPKLSLYFALEMR